MRRREKYGNTIQIGMQNTRGPVHRRYFCGYSMNVFVSLVFGMKCYWIDFGRRFCIYLYFCIAYSIMDLCMSIRNFVLLGCITVALSIHIANRACLRSRTHNANTYTMSVRALSALYAVVFTHTHVTALNLRLHRHALIQCVVYLCSLHTKPFASKHISFFNGSALAAHE